MSEIDYLSVPMAENDADVRTVGEYLYFLLFKVWDEGESFSGKRPFGNSGWEYELYTALVAAGIVEGEIDEDGCLTEFDEQGASEAVYAAIEQIAFKAGLEV